MAGFYLPRFALQLKRWTRASDTRPPPYELTPTKLSDRRQSIHVKGALHVDVIRRVTINTLGRRCSVHGLNPDTVIHLVIELLEGSRTHGVAALERAVSAHARHFAQHQAAAERHAVAVSLHDERPDRMRVGQTGKVAGPGCNPRRGVVNHVPDLGQRIAGSGRA